MSQVTEALKAIEGLRGRDWDDIRVQLLKECSGLSFARKAQYAVTRGGKVVTGPSKKFVDAVLRLMGNVRIQPLIVSDDADKTIVRATVADLETNVVHARDVVVTKTVERRALKAGQSAIEERLNANGERVFVVLGTESEIQQKQSALVSKALRNCGVKIIPFDLMQESLQRCAQTIAQSQASTP